MTDKANN